jgi:unsaturated chondroitin disaccharide hydrolase
MIIDQDLDIASLQEKLATFWELAGNKVRLLQTVYDPSAGSPVFTVEGRYTTRGWTEWTQGFQYGIPLLVFDATGDPGMLEIGRDSTLAGMSHHISHFGVHDHGFNNLSTYGNLLRLANLDRFVASREEKAYYELAIKLSGAVQARRWSTVEDGGFIYSFNGPHSLFIDTIRTCRILLLAHRLGHRMLDEHDAVVNLLERAVVHGLTTAKYAVYYGEGRDSYDVWGRVAHESIFNMNDGRYRCPNSQQGYSGFSTWTRGLGVFQNFSNSWNRWIRITRTWKMSKKHCSGQPGPPVTFTLRIRRRMAFLTGIRGHRSFISSEDTRTRPQIPTMNTNPLTALLLPLVPRAY